MLTMALSRFPEFISRITLTYVAARCVGAVMVTASIVISALINVCSLGGGHGEPIQNNCE